METTGDIEKLEHWVARLPANAVESVAAIRLETGIEVARSGDDLWLRGKAASHGVLSLPFLELYRSDENDPARLIPRDATLPTARLPGCLEWEAASTAIIPIRKIAPFPRNDRGEKSPVSVVRSGEPREATLLRVPLNRWIEWVEDAPGIRLNRLHFAASGDEAIIRGQPLPSIRGGGWFESDGIALPVGYGICPTVSHRVLATSIGLAPGEIALLSPNGVIDRISEENFVLATRSAIRSISTPLEL